MNKKPSLPSHATPSAAAGTRQSPRLVRRGPSPMALEQRFMFDGAAVAEAVHELAAPEPAEAAPPAELLTFDTPATLPAAVVSARAEAERLVGEMLAGPDAREQLFALFNGGQQQPSEAWDSRVDALLQQMAAGEYQLPVQLVSDTTLQGARAAFTAAGPDGGPVIYLNGDWVQGGADTDSLTRALSEEIGHALDAYLNGRDDTAGDEGEAFSYLLANGVLRLEAVSGLSDHGTIEIAGQQVEAEFANYRFVAAYQMVYDLNNNGTVEGNLGETAAEKEQNLHNFNATDLGQVTVDDGIGSRMFSGNDVSASAIVIGGTTYYGWISRPIKANGVVRGFYFWTDTDFVDLTSAQADGNMDRDANTADNRGFVLVVDQAWFNAQITATRTTVATDIDGVAGQHTYSNVGSSSDRVDTALNSLLSTNTVTAAPDVLVVNEDSAATTGNLLANDSDANNDRFTLTGYTIAGLSGAQPLGQDVLIAGVGTIRIASSGAYSFTPAADYTGAVPVISYTITDSWGATSTTTFSINVAPGNDPPTAVNDSHTLVEDTPATGNVLANDSDPDGDVLVVTGFSIAGQAGPFTLGSAYAIAGVGSFTLFANGSYSFVPAANYTGAVPVVSYAISDGKGGTSSATLGLVVSPVNDAPTAVADNADSALYATAAGCANGVPVAATTQSGNVLANDTDPDLAVVPGVTHEVSAVTGSTGAVWNGTTVSGRYGILTIAADGSYSYAIDGSNAAVLALAAGQSLSETFSYTLREIGSTALSSTSTLRIVIRGSNNAPEARDDAEAVNELAASQTTNTVVNYGTASAVASGVLANDTDPDGGTLTVVDIAAAGTATATFQTSTSETNLVLTFSGTPSQLTSSFYIYYLDAGLSDTSPVLLYADAGLTTALRPSSVVGNGSNRNVNLSTNGAVYYSDGLGGSVALSLTQNTVLGFDDVSSNPSGANYYRATISSAPTVVSSASFTVSAATGTLANGMTVTCTDAGFGSFAAQVSGLQYNATTGQIESFTLSSASNSFTPGASYQLVFDSKVSAGATLQGQYGYVEIAANGAYTYYLTSNALAAGQVFTERFTYTVSDGSCTDTAVLSIRVTGTQTQLTDTADTELEDTANTGSVPVGGQALSSFTWDGQTASAGQTLTVAGVGSLTLAGDGSYTFSPASNYTGPVPTATYLVTDGAAATLSLAITPVNDAPAGTDKTVTLTDKQGYTFSAADFGFSDMDDAPSNSLESVRVTAIPTLTAGSLRLNGTSVQAGDVISVAQLGNLVYTPLENASQDPRLVFTFQVIDDGGTANGGVNTDPTPNTFTIEVTPVNDAPVNTLPSALTTPSYQAISFASLPTVISAGDPDSLSDLRNIQTVVLSVSSGTLSLTAGAGVSIAGNGTGAVTLTSTGSGSAGQAQLQAVLASLVYQPLSTFHGLDLLQVVTTDKEGLADIDTLSITVQPDDRPLVVTGTQVNEASPYLLFEVDGEVGQWVTLALGSTGSGIGHAELGSDVLLGLQYFDGAAWVDYTGQAVQIPATVAGGAANTGGRMLVRVAVVQDSAWESTAAAYETLSLTAWNQAGTPNTISGALDAFDEGLGRIRDDGQGAIYQGDSNTLTPYTPVSGDPLPDDDRPLGVDDVWVNEGSPYAVFTVSGVAGQWVTLALGEGAASQENGDGTVASDGSEDFGARLQYWDGSAWADYSAGSWVQIPLGGSTLLVRTAIVDDALNEGQHDFRLTVGNTGGSFAFGTAVIDDHGAGVKYPDAAPDGNGIPATSTQLLDDDRPLTVDDITVNEASPTAVFTVTGAAGQQVSLQLVATGSAAGDATLGTDTGDVPTRQVPLQYSTDGGASWTDYGSYVSLVGTTLLVRTGIAQDASYEGAETFRLVATNTGGTPNVTGVGQNGIATIVDDGTGTVFKVDGTDDTAATRDDDRPLTVDDITVNEASPTAVFTVTGASGQQVSLQLVATGSAAGDATLGTDTGDVPTRQVPLQCSTDSGASWTDYNAGSRVTLVGTTLLVRTGIAQDGNFEGAETFRLVATNTGGTPNVTGVGQNGIATIVDDGTGSVFKEDGSNDTAATRDDDRPLTVDDITVNEASATAVFTVTGAAGQQVSLQLVATGSAAGDATLGTDTGDVPSRAVPLQYSTNGGASWTDYNAGSRVTLVGTTLLVRTGIAQDASYEGAETFRLVATNTGGTPNVQTAGHAGIATIVDNGTGTVFEEDGTNDTAATRDDDRLVTVTGGLYNEDSARAVFTVQAYPGQLLTLDVQDAAGTGQQPTAGLDSADLYYSVDGGATWQRYTAPFAAGSVPVLVAVDIAAERDSAYEGEEQLRLVVNPGQQTEGSAYASILDDGTGVVTEPIDGSSVNTTGADSGSPRDDDRPLTVDDITVNEASPTAVFTVTGAAGQQVSLQLVATGSATGDATLGADTGDVPSRQVPLQYSTDGGASWADYNAGSHVSLVGATLLVRTGIAQDANFEGAETFRLVATNTGGTPNVQTAGHAGIATIVDNGTGTVFEEDGTNDTAATRDDDRLVTVTGGTYNEDSARAVFTVQAYPGQLLTLDVQDAAGTGQQPTAGLDSADLYYSVNGGATWQRYTAPFAAGSVPVLVAVDIAAERDSAYEGEEQLRLVVNPGQQTEGSAYASILDDGTGTVTDPIDEHSTGTPGTDNGQSKDDDRPLTVTGGSYNENSPRAVFTVHAHPGQRLTLDVQDAAGTGKLPTGSQAGPADDLDNAAIDYSVDGGASWQAYTGVFVAGAVDVLVAVDIGAERDEVYEGEEQLRLVVNPGRPNEARGHASLFDNGTGVLTGPIDGSSINTTGADTGLPRDDDRRVSVNDISVNEGSPYGVFTLSGTPGLPVTLELQDGSATAADYGPALETSSDGGSTWVPYTGGGVALGSDGQLLVRTPIRQDMLFEGRETFGLRVGRPDGASVVGSAAITDDGTGTVYGPDGAEDSSTRKDDDRPVGQVPPPAPPPPAPVAVPAPAPLPPVEAPQVTQAPFDSTLQSPGASPLVLVPQVIMESLTSERGFPIVVLQGATPALTLHGGVSDQFVEPDRASRFALPADTFAHTKRDAVISLSAMQADGTPLPPWVQFDPQSGTFTVDAPPGFTGELKLLVIARDDEGREARAPFRLFVGEETAKPKPPGRAGLSEQLKLAGKRAGALPDWLRLAPAKAVPERASPDKQADPREVV